MLPILFYVSVQGIALGDNPSKLFFPDNILNWEKPKLHQELQHRLADIKNYLFHLSYSHSGFKFQRHRWRAKKFWEKLGIQ